LSVYRRENMKIPKNEKQAIKTKKCFPNKRVDDLFWENSKILGERRLIDEPKRSEIYEMFLNAFEDGYKKGFASGESYCSEKELYQEVADEFEQMTKNDTYEELYGSQKGDK
tara:strand:+ start:279 stop:614 length:336 start_codon:yes stop_codon:yes gene_type:complete